MVSLSVALVVIVAIHAGSAVDVKFTLFLLTGLLDVAIAWAVAVAIRGWPESTRDSLAPASIQRP